ncbi:MAG: hypothetical protein ROZ09_11515 [Thiobacillus sp.]|jgi:hypothetical protein|uniref:hypothetical protein n=1 Tax=Thiobacillus sp. TaxID=924 RepID=UPI0028942E83|nr:hypothetical protein [Thiobacillus sp.]MDT3707447.1 hypothetical protein [Thiobacillus sp.]
MKEHPILFSAPMVRALLAGTKTQTRRVVKVQPADLWPDGVECSSAARGLFRVLPSDVQANIGARGLMYAAGCQSVGPIACPYGQPGDRLWVRETWGPCDGGACYRVSERDGVLPDGGKWRPSIYMPRWASRITLEIVSVRVERLQDISEEDAKAEGCEPTSMGPNGIRLDVRQPTYRNGYAQLWNEINGPGSWEANPWVWVIEFKRVVQ